MSLSHEVVTPAKVSPGWGKGGVPQQKTDVKCWGVDIPLGTGLIFLLLPPASTSFLFPEEEWCFCCWGGPSSSNFFEYYEGEPGWWPLITYLSILDNNYSWQLFLSPLHHLVHSAISHEQMRPWHRLMDLDLICPLPQARCFFSITCKGETAWIWSLGLTLTNLT